MHTFYGHFGPKTHRHLSQDISGRCGRPTAGESDSDVSMRTHVFMTVSSCFATLRQLRSVRRSTSQAVLVSLVISLVLSRLDYGNATLAGLPGNQLDRLQSVMNAAARLGCSARKYEHITPLLRKAVPKCLVTLQNRCRSVLDTTAAPTLWHRCRCVLGPKCPGAEVSRHRQKSHFYHTQLVGSGLAAPSQKLHPGLGPYRPIHYYPY